MLERLQEAGPLLHTPGVRVMLKELAPQGHIPSHAHPGHQVLVSVLRGEVRLGAPDAQLELRAGELARLDEHTPIELKAGPEGATFTVTLARLDRAPAGGSQ